LGNQYCYEQILTIYETFVEHIVLQQIYNRLIHCWPHHCCDAHWPFSDVCLMYLYRPVPGSHKTDVVQFDVLLTVHHSIDFFKLPT